MLVPSAGAGASAAVAAAATALLMMLACLSPSVEAHPTFYPAIKNSSACQDVDHIPFLSYHVHILFWQNNNQSTADALAFRQFAIDHFNLTNEPLCEGLFDQGRLCAFDPDMQPAGPFLTAQWSFFLLPEQFNLIVPWFMQHRGSFDLLVHPNTGCEIEDHTVWALWGGNSWEIDLSAFSHEYPGDQ